MSKGTKKKPENCFLYCAKEGDMGLRLVRRKCVEQSHRPRSGSRMSGSLRPPVADGRAAAGERSANDRESRELNKSAEVTRDDRNLFVQVDGQARTDKSQIVRRMTERLGRPPRLVRVALRADGHQRDRGVVGNPVGPASHSRGEAVGMKSGNVHQRLWCDRAGAD